MLETEEQKKMREEIEEEFPYLSGLNPSGGIPIPTIEKSRECVQAKCNAQTPLDCHKYCPLIDTPSCKGGE